MWSSCVCMSPDRLALTIAVRRLLLCEELERSSCGSVLFHGYLPPPGTAAHGPPVFKNKSCFGYLSFDGSGPHQTVPFHESEAMVCRAGLVPPSVRQELGGIPQLPLSWRIRARARSSAGLGHCPLSYLPELDLSLCSIVRMRCCF